MTFSLRCLFLLLGSLWDEEPQASVSALVLPPIQVLTWISFEFPAFFLRLEDTETAVRDWHVPIYPKHRWSLWAHCTGRN